MDAKLLGVPLALWGVLCLLLTVIWAFNWPSDRAISVTGLRYVILRWFHALVWLLLTVAAFLAAFNVLGGATTARLISFLGLIVYLLFIATLVTTR